MSECVFVRIEVLVGVPVCMFLCALEHQNVFARVGNDFHLGSHWSDFDPIKFGECQYVPRLKCQGVSLCALERQNVLNC